MNIQEFIRTSRTGQLSIDEIGRGMHKSFKNACELIEDAELLLEKRPARALSLAVLAMEEIAKTILLANAAARAARIQVTWEEIQKDLDLRSHEKKQTVFAAYGNVVLNKLASIDEKQKYYEQEVPGGIEPLLDYLKQLGFYVDVANAKFVSPSDFGRDNKEWAEWTIAVAKERLESFEPLHVTEDKSIEVARKAAEFAALVLNANNEDQLKENIRNFLKKYCKRI